MNTKTPIAAAIERISARDLAAIKWLLQYLKDGPKQASEGRAAAQAAGIAIGALVRARKILGIKKHKENGTWVGWRRECWELPPGPPFKLPENVKVTPYNWTRRHRNWWANLTPHEREAIMEHHKRQMAKAAE